ncbi:sigma-54-dependent transcriptional regulator [Botrimarina mediterranea]|uniref:DNA-binding transcriptional regulator NtrC n=1 Tax=Botrimarina mediterranea TaxID=2528022 RepID=A0A518K800_9BACT|nr:sigma-54 dependent transcriptional regulator [Botrimarina mediterranea]QDV73924.1 Nitrogen regulation protein NR(I) [Botrimarina mediterranea]
MPFGAIIAAFPGRWQMVRADCVADPKQHVSVNTTNPASGPVVLVIDDDPLIPIVVRRAMEGAVFRMHVAADGAAGVDEVSRCKPDVVILDNVLPDCLGLNALTTIHELAPSVPILFVTARGSGGSAIEAMKLCAFDYLPKPLDPPKLRSQIDRALALRRLLSTKQVAEEDTLWPPRESLSLPPDPTNLVGDCPAMQSVFKAIGKVAMQDIAVLIRGEHGTGKESVAREIHAHSHRSSGPLVKLHCRGLDERRADEVLFGRSVEEGSTSGRIAEAAGGTLLLEEVGDLPLAIQARVLRAIRDGVYEIAGSAIEHRVECRLLAITTVDLESRSREGKFRSDLYYALSSFAIELPPVRARHGDLRLLVEHSLRKLSPIAAAFGVKEPRISEEAFLAMSAHHWPGNIDELESVLKRALIEQKGNVLLPAEITRAVSGASVVPAADPSASALCTTDWTTFTDMRIEAGSDSLHAEAIAETERKLFTRVLHHTRGNQAHAARLLGITRVSLRKKLRMYGMAPRSIDE